MKTKISQDTSVMRRWLVRSGPVTRIIFSPTAEKAISQFRDLNRGFVPKDAPVNAIRA